MKRFVREIFKLLLLMSFVSILQPVGSKFLERYQRAEATYGAGWTAPQLNNFRHTAGLQLIGQSRHVIHKSESKKNLSELEYEIATLRREWGRRRVPVEFKDAYLRFPRVFNCLENASRFLKEARNSTDQNRKEYLLLSYESELLIAEEELDKLEAEFGSDRFLEILAEQST